MNDRLTYESVIAAKLEQLPPLQGLADTIWSRISEDLDRDMPSEDDGGDPAPGGGGGPRRLFWPGIAIVILAFLGILLWVQRPSDSGIVTPDNEATPTELGPSPAASPPTLPAPGKFMPGQRSDQASRVTDTGAGFERSATDPISLPVADSMVGIPNTTVAGRDSLETAPPVIIQPPPSTLPKADTPRKKPRGVTGINPGDFRIIPASKDSGKQKKNK